MTLAAISGLRAALASSKVGAAGKPGSPDAALKAARLLESMFVRQLVRSLGKDSAASSLFGKSLGQSVYQEMFKGAVADKIYDAGGLGLASQLVSQLGGKAGAGGVAMPRQLTASLTAMLSRVAPAAVAPSSSITSGVKPRAAAAQLVQALRAQRGRQALAPVSLPPAGKAPEVSTSDARGVDLGGVRYAAPHRRSFSLPKDADGRLAAPLSGTHRALGADGRFAATSGERVRAAASGRVSRVLAEGVLVEHAGGRQTLYRGLGKVSAQAGDLVLRGQELGRVGSEGRLFFGVKAGATWIDPSRVGALLSR